MPVRAGRPKNPLSMTHYEAGKPRPLRDRELKNPSSDDENDLEGLYDTGDGYKFEELDFD